MNKAFIIATATALSFGYAAGFASDGLVAKAAISQKREVQIEKPLRGGASTTLENFLENQLYPDVVDKFDLAVKECTADIFKSAGFCIGWIDSDPGYWKVVAP